MFNLNISLEKYNSHYRFILGSHTIDSITLLSISLKIIILHCHTIKWIILSFYIVVVYLNKKLILIVIILNFVSF